VLAIGEVECLRRHVRGEWRQDKPTVLAIGEVERLLAALARPKYRVLFTTVYATGLCIREACQRETGNIDAARGVIHVRYATRKKERFVMLDPRLSSILRAYYALKQPPAPCILTVKTTPARWLHPNTARKALKLAVARAGLETRAPTLFRDAPAQERHGPARDPGAARTHHDQDHDALRGCLYGAHRQDPEPPSSG
jgi:integrase